MTAAAFPDALWAIARRQIEYARSIDDLELETWPSFFVPECRYVITTAANVADGLQAGLVFCNSKDMLRDRISALREANVYERQRYRHMLGLPYIVSEHGRVVKTETPFTVVRIMRTGETELFASGRYLDVWTLAEAQPLLIERIVVCDSSHIDTLLALPL
jgi:anthranilate 1,2-dioxygenase small subunit